MGISDFEKGLMQKHNAIVILYVNHPYSNQSKKGRWAIKVFNGQRKFCEIKNNEQVRYDSIDKLLNKSDLYSKHKNKTTVIVQADSNDASKWTLAYIKE